MGKRAHRPKRGSLAYSPRVRAPRPVAHVRAWPEDDSLRLQGFAGYKAGMTHVFIIDDRKHSLTAGQEISVPATVIEAPPLLIYGIRLYGMGARGLRTIAEVLAGDLPKDLSRAISLPKGYDQRKALERAEALVRGGEAVDIRVLACTQPRLSSVPKKKPDVIEVRVGGSSVEERWSYCKGLLGRQVRAADVFREGELVDVTAITKGKGTAGPVKRWGVKILPRKTRKGRRQVGAIGPWSPSRVMWTVPMAGQMGYHQRTEFNKRILKLGKSGEEATPEGGFLRYGPVKGDYILLSGSVPGPTKRLITIRRPLRPARGPTTLPTITYISTTSKQGA